MKCQFCQREIPSEQRWKVHEKHCLQNPNRVNVKCRICGKEFETPQKVSGHTRTVHAGEFKSRGTPGRKPGRPEITQEEKNRRAAEGVRLSWKRRKAQTMPSTSGEHVAVAELKHCPQCGFNLQKLRIALAAIGGLQ